MSTREDKLKTVARINTLVIIAIIAILLMIIGFTAHKRFSKTYYKELANQANIMALELDSGFNAEMSLAKQMAKSPVIVSYMENPTDKNLEKLGMQEIERYQDSFASHVTFWIGEKDLKYYSNGEYIYTLDKADPSSAWYLNCMKLKNDYELNVDYDIGLKVTNVWVNAVVKNEKSEFIGLIGTGISLSSFMDRMYSSLDSQYEMYMYNANLETTGSTNFNYLEDKTQITKVLPEINGKNLNPGKITLFSTKKADFVILPIPSLDWNIIIKKPYTFKDALSVSMTYIFLVIVIVLILFLVLTINHLISPLSALGDTIEGIALGNADLTRRLELKGNSSMKLIHKLVNNFNRFIQRLQEIISSVKLKKDELIGAGNELRAGTQETAASIEQIISNIQSFSITLDRQSEEVEGAALIVEKLYENCELLNQSVESQSASVVQASAAVEEMVGNIDSVNNSVGKLSMSFQSLEKEAEKGLVKQDEVRSKIERIREQSEILQSANEMIASIAEQTNLLAMNAAIEAAHAGEAGKGFSVVADEIRKLSETSSEQSNTIGEQLHTIKESIDSITESSISSQETFISVASDIKQTNTLVNEITDAMEEQAAGSRQINEALGSLNNSMGEVKSATVDMSENGKLIVEEMHTLQDSTISMKQGMEEMTTGAQKISETGVNLSRTADNVDESITVIGMQIDQFKV